MSSVFSLRQVLVIQGAVGVVALAAGGAVGYAVGRSMLAKEQLTRFGMTCDDLLQRLRASEKQYADLYGYCEPLQGSEQDLLREAQDRVQTLKTEIAVKEEEIARLEKKARENVALKAELEVRKAELGQLKTALAAAEQERAELAERLQVAVQETSVARAETHAARQENLDLRWDEFKTGAALTICEKGTRSRMEKCRASVLAAMTPDRERRYRECVRKNQAVPQLRELQKGEKEIPAFAEWLGTGEKYIQDWYILFCDPTLPEAPDGGAARAVVGEGDPAEVQTRPDAMQQAVEDETTTP